MALDKRITAAAPSCYINRQGSQIRGAYGDAEQQIFGQLAFGMDHPDYLMMQAPRQRVLILATTDDFFDIHATWRSFRYAKRLYTRLGFAQRIDLLENDAKHNYNRQQREGAVRWMARSLAGYDGAIREPEIRLISEMELQCTPHGQVAHMEGYRSTYDLNEAYEKQLARHRKQLWAAGDRSDLLRQVRKLTGIRQLGELPVPEVEEVGITRVGGHRVERLIIKPEPGIYLPAWWHGPDKPATELVLYLHEDGHGNKEAHAAINDLVRAGRTVLAVDLRGIGETSPGNSWKQGSPTTTASFTPLICWNTPWSECVLKTFSSALAMPLQNPPPTSRSASIW